MRKSLCMGLVAVAVASGMVLTAVAAPANPVMSTVAYINGKMNIGVWYKEGALRSPRRQTRLCPPSPTSTAR